MKSFRAIFGPALLLFCIASLWSCGPAHKGEVGTQWPDGLDIIGYGFPDTGDPCRLLNETPAIAGLASGLTLFAGCPGDVSSDITDKIYTQYSAKIVGEYEGIMIIAIPLD